MNRFVAMTAAMVLALMMVHNAQADDRDFRFDQRRIPVDRFRDFDRDDFRRFSPPFFFFDRDDFRRFSMPRFDFDRDDFRRFPMQRFNHHGSSRHGHR
jgi:hypothetical protein